jgi:hypothetical protein
MESESCNDGAPSSVTTQPDLSESSPGEPDTAETLSRISILADHIRTALEGRPLPIRIKQGEVISDLELFAKAHARAIVKGSPNISELAKERLQRLGITL